MWGRVEESREGNRPHAPLLPTWCPSCLPLISPVTQGKGSHRMGFQDFRDSPPHPSGLQSHEGGRPPEPLTESWDVRAKRHLDDPPSLILPGEKLRHRERVRLAQGHPGVPRGARRGQVSLRHPGRAAPETAVLKEGERRLPRLEGRQAPLARLTCTSPSAQCKVLPETESHTGCGRAWSEAP